MKLTPTQLVGTGTAVAAAAAGLVFAQPANEPDVQRPMSARPNLNAIDRDHASSVTPPSASRPPVSRPMAKSISYVSAPSAAAAADDRARNVSNGSSNTSSSFSTRPSQIAPSEASVAPSSTATLPRSTASSSSQGGWNRRHSLIHRGDWIPPPISEVSRDSISSNSSWIRRLSIRPLSQHGSPRSSVGPDSLSLNFSLGSAAPILSQQSSTPHQQQQSRNKLVKRATAGQDAAPISLSRRGSRSQMPTLRRPATSHQRSATLHQAPYPDELASATSTAADPKFSFDQRTRPSLAIFRLGAETPDPPVDQDDQAETNGKLEEIAHAHEEPQLPQQKEKESFQTKWTSFFHGRLTKSTAPVRGSSPFSSDSSPGGTHYSLPSRTLQVQRGKQSRTYLTQASALSALGPALVSSPPPAPAGATAKLASPFQSPIAIKTIRKTVEGNGDDMTASAHGSNSSPQDTPSKRARRSISMNFSSPTSWMSKTGSIRRPKRGTEYPPNASTTGSLRMNRQLAAAAAAGSPSSGKRHVSAPMSVARPSSAQAHYQQFQTRSATTPADLHLRKPVEGVFQQAYRPGGAPEREQAAVGRSSPIPPSYVDARAIPKRQRNSSSPLPPLSRLSSFNIDLTRLGASSSASGQLAAAVSGGSASYKENQASVHPGFATLPRSFPLVPRNRDVSDERSSTLAGSDLELRGFASSGDDDDTDFKSDTIFDSIRTAASARVRSTDTPIESMFDESPPSTAGNGKAKRLSIQEILGQAWDSDTRIMEEEDEGFSTPIRTLPAKAERSLSPASVMRHFDEDYVPADSRDNYPETEANSVLASTTTDTDADVNFPHSNDVDYSRPSLEDDDDDDWARIDDSGVTNHLSPPSRSLHNSFHEMSGLFQSNNTGFPSSHHQRPALGLISGNGGIDPSSEQYDNFMTGGRERPRSNLFDWSESTVHLDKIDSDGHSPRPKTVHGKQELDLRNGRPANRKGPAVAHVRSQSVPVNADPATEGTKPSTSKFGTWASGPKNASEDWDDDFDFGTNHGDDDIDENNFDGFDTEEEDAFGRSSTLRSSKGPGSFAMIVPASIQATQPTVKAHSGQIRELSLLVNGLKRLCRHARDLNIVDESPALWKEAENIIALASPDEDFSEAAASKTKPAAAGSSGTPVKTAKTVVASVENDSDIPRASIEFDASDVEDRFLDARFDAETRDSFEDDPFDTSEFAQAPGTPPRPEMSRTAVVRERHNTRRRSVFSPEDDIFGGGWPLADEKSPARQTEKEVQRPQTPNRFTAATEAPDSAMIESIMAAMQQQRSASAPIRKSPVKQTSTSELFFNTNTLQELVKRANTLFHTLSDLVRRAELFTQSPAVTPRHDRLNRREDGSPAFTRVFTDPSSPSKRLPKSHSGNSVARASPALESPSTNRVSQRLQMMVN